MAVNQLITSFALVATAYSHILNAEAETASTKDILSINKSATKLINSARNNEILKINMLQNLL